MITLQMDREENGTSLAGWESFLVSARRAGAVDGDVIEEETAYQDPDVLTGYRITVSGAGPEHTPEKVTLPTKLLQNLIYVASHLASGDGDARGLVGPAQETMDQVNEHFRSLALGPNPYAPAE